MSVVTSEVETRGTSPPALGKSRVTLSLCFF